MPTARRGLLSLAALALFLGLAGPAAAEECEDAEFDSTFALIQSAIFDKYSCNTAICHGSFAAGGLDLSPAVAWENLLDVDAASVPGWTRVLAGQAAKSLLWLNLAAKTLPAEHRAPLRSMPLDPVPAISENELEALRLWIERGAPKEGVVEGTGELLDACLPDPKPIEIKPLDPPPPGTGVQIAMPGRYLDGQSEEEVCFATYYDVTDQVPPQFRSADGTKFRFKRHTVRQDPLSHHLIPFVYDGPLPASDPVWGPWTCRGGDREGTTCDPYDQTSCGTGGMCMTRIADTIACIGFGPGDAAVGLQSGGISVTQETAAEFTFDENVYDELPMRGFILWDSHAFNLNDEPGLLRAWLNFEFAPPAEQITPVRQIFNAEELFATSAPAFGTHEPCHVHYLPPNARLFEISTHMHRFGKRFRIFEGEFTCQGGPADGLACSPLGYDFVSPDVCQGAPCASLVRKRVCDCNKSGDVTVDEVITGVNIALGTAVVSACGEADGDGDLNVSVDEVITGVNAALSGVPAPTPRDPEDSMMYVSYQYDDPVVMRFQPAKVHGGPGTRPDERAYTYCALYDNGHTNPAEVKRRSTSPATPIAFPGIGGPCDQATHCAEGKVGQPCSGRGENNRNRSCDTAPGANDGMCDACPLEGGVTTEDEMFLLLGQYYVP